eukprot:g10341.t1
MHAITLTDKTPKTVFSALVEKRMIFKKVGGVLIICLMLLSVVSAQSEKKEVCGAGFERRIVSGYIFVSSGKCLKPITTKDECRKASVENNANGLDVNSGFMDPPGWGTGNRAYGCVHHSRGGKWYDFYGGKITTDCLKERTCICHKHQCTKCTPNTYSKGGTNSTCTPCPENRQYTFLNSKQDSEDSCTSKEDALKCEAGEGVPSGATFISGDASQCSGVSKITTEAECKLAAEYNSMNKIDKNNGYGGPGMWSHKPPGCGYYSGSNKYWFNDPTSKIKCSNDYKCICKPKTCTKCPPNTYSKGGINPTCTSCPEDRPYTFLNSKQDSENSCTSKKGEVKCEAGEGVPSGATFISVMI